MKSKAAVLTDERTIQIRTFDVPAELGPGEALLEAEASGMCGSDVGQFNGEFEHLPQYPVIPGHEPVGRIVEMGEKAQETWPVGVGDRVAVESFVACGVCEDCATGHAESCANRFLYGFVQTTEDHGLWGGYSQYMVLRENTLVHPLPDHVSTEDAVLFNPLAGGISWAYREAGTEIGDTVLVLGPGQRGLASVIAANEAGADEIIVTGLPEDGEKLSIATDFGATHTIDVEAEDVISRVTEITDGDLADRVVDTTPTATQPVRDAINAVRQRGTVVLAGMKDGNPVPDFVTDDVVLKQIRIRGVLGLDTWSYRRATELIAAGEYPFERMHTHTVGLEDLSRAIRTLGGETDDRAIHVTVTPP